MIARESEIVNAVQIRKLQYLVRKDRQSRSLVPDLPCNSVFYSINGPSQVINIKNLSININFWLRAMLHWFVCVSLVRIQ